jgi:hypothetical protein
MGSATKFLSGTRKLGADQSLQLDAIWRSLWPGLGMLAGGVGTLGTVVSQNPLWLVAMVFTPLALLAIRRRTIRFEVSQRVLWVDDRALPFDQIRDLTLVAEAAQGPSLLTVNGEALTWVQSTWDNKNLEQELRAALSSAGAAPGRSSEQGAA